MGKGRKGRRQLTGSDEEGGGPQSHWSGEMVSATMGNNSDGDGDDDDGNKNGNKTNTKNMDFAQRRALQRQQAAEKRRSKQKCYLCGRAGHVRRECPGILDDGRGMSHYKGKSDKASEKQKLMDRRKQRGSSGNHDAALTDMLPDYPEAFTRPNNNGGTATDDHSLLVSENDGCPIYFDVHCNILASIEYLRQGRGKTKKVSLKAAVDEYRAALAMATGLRAMISQTFLLKPGRPWTNPLSFDLPDDDDDTTLQVLFVLGLSEAFHCNDETQREETIEALVGTIHEHPDQIIAVGSTLDYSPETVIQPGMDQESQVCRLQACWKAAGQAKVPLQLHISPGAASLDPEKDGVAGTDYAKVLLDAQSQLTAATNLYPDFAIHIVGWCGKAAHMIALLQAFPQNIRAVGLDGTVGFAKATDLHECAFDVPLDRLVLETSTTIPIQVNNRMGRDEFFHSGWWPFVAQSVADHKKNVPLEEIIRATNQNALALYPQLLKPAPSIGTSEE